jgi:hypothetical protein
MADDKKISELDAVASPSLTDVVPVVNDATTKKLTLSQLRTLFLPIDVTTELSAPVMQGPAASVDDEVALYSGVTGKLLKRATQTGRPKLTSGVLSVAAIDILTETTGFPADTTEFLRGDGSFASVTPAWTNVAYDALNFTGLNSMTWTVGSDDQFTYTYTVIGKIMLLSFDVRHSTVGGTADKFLLLKIPGGYTSQSTSSSVVICNDNNAGEAVCRATTITSGSQLLLGRLDSANWTLCTNLTAVFGLAIFGVN